MAGTKKRTVHPRRSAGSNETTRPPRTRKQATTNELPAVYGSEERNTAMDSPRNYLVPERKSSRDKLYEITKQKNNYPVEEESAVKKNSFQEAAEPLLELTKTALKKDGETTSEDDKFMAVLEGGIKYAPKIAEILSTVAQNIRARNPSLPQRQNNLPQAPPGWHETGALEKLKRKYDSTGNITAWYAAGVAYEQSLDTTGNNIPPSYPATPQAPPSRVKQWTPTVEEGPPTMPPVYEGVPVSGGTHVSEEELKKQLQQPKEDPKTTQRAVMVQSALKKIDSAEEEKLLEAINNPSQLLAAIKEYTVFMDQEFLHILKNTPTEEYLEAMKQYCPSKKELLENDETKKKIVALLQEAKNIL